MAIYFFNKNQTLIKIVPESATFEAIQTQELDDDSLLKDTLSVTVKGDEKLLNAEYMAVKSYTGNAQTFDMYRIVTDSTPDKTMTFTGMSLAPYELNGHILKDLRPSNQSVEYTLNRILDGTDWRLGYIDDGLPNVTTTFYYVSAKEALKELQSLVGCEFVFKVEISGQKITDKWIEIYKEMGNRTKKRFNYGTNALTVVRETNKVDIYTALIGRGKGEEVSSAEDNESGQAGYGRKITFEDIEWSIAKGDPLNKPKGQYYLELPQATQVYGIKNIDGTMSARVGVVDFDDETDKNRLINLTYQQLLVSSRPKVLFKTTVANIGATGIGDTVTIHRHDLGIHYQTRVRKIVRNKLNDNKTQIELGDAVVTASTKQAKENNATIKNLTQELEKVKDDVTTSQTSADGKNTIFYGSKEPERQRTGDTWYRPHPSIAGETQMLVWNGTAWELVVDSSDLTSVEREVEAAIEEVEKAVQSAQDADVRANSALEKAGANANLLTTHQNTIDTINTVTLPDIASSAGTALANAKDAMDEAKKADEKIANFVTTNGLVNGTTVDSKIDEATGEISRKITTVESKIPTEIGGRNLIVRNTLQVGYYINSTTGAIVRSVSADVVTDWIDISGAKELTFTTYDKYEGDFKGKVALYSDKSESNFISLPVEYTSASPIQSYTFEVPENAKYARVGVVYGDTLRYKLEKGSIPTDWTPAPEDNYTQEEFKIFESMYSEDVKGINSSLTDLSNKKLDGTTYTTFYNNEYKKTAQGVTDTYSKVNKIIDANGNSTDTFAKAVYDRNATRRTEDFTEVTNGLVKEATYTAGINGLSGSITTIQGKLDNLQVGGRNLLRGTADFDTSFWQNVSTSIPSTKDSRYKQVRVIGDFSVAPITTMSVQGWNFEVGEDYVVSVYAKSEVSGNKIGLTAQSSAIYFEPQVVDVWEWRRFVWKFTATSSNLTKFRFETRNDEKVWITQPQIEKGSVPTDWSPAPEDMLGKADFQIFKGAYEANDKTIKARLLAVDSGKEGSIAYRLNATESTASGNSQLLTTIKNNYVTQKTIDASILADKKIIDTRNTNELPPYYYNKYPKQEVREFKTISVMGIGSGNYGILTTKVPWTDSTGGTVKQKFETNTETHVRQGSSGGTYWGAWSKQIDTADTTYQKITQTSSLYERVLGSTDETGVKSNISRVVQTSGLIQQQVLGVSGQSLNLIVRKDEYKNKYLVSGNLTDSGTGNAVMKDKIPVVAGEMLTFTKTTSLKDDHWRIEWYDSDGKYMNRLADTNNLILFQVPQGASYLWVSYPNSSNVQLERGEDRTPWKPSLIDIQDGYGGRNLLRNSDFSSGKVPWGVNNASNVAIDEATGIVKVSKGNRLSGIYQNVISELDVGEIYTISAEVKGTGSILMGFSDNRKSFPLTAGVWSKLSYTTTHEDKISVTFYSDTTDTEFEIRNLQVERGMKATDWTPNPEDTNSKITQLADNINLRVTKEGLLNQINLSAGGVLITSGTNKLNITPETTYIQDATIKSAMIESLLADKITTGTLDAGKVRVINLDANNITGNLTEFIKSNWNEATGGGVTITGGGVRAINSEGSRVTLENGVVSVGNRAGVNLGFFGDHVLNKGATGTMTITASHGTETAFISATSTDGKTYKRSMSIMAGAGEIDMFTTLDMNKNSLKDVTDIGFTGGLIKGNISGSARYMTIDAGTGTSFDIGGATRMSITSVVNIFSGIDMKGKDIASVGKLTYNSDQRLKTNIKDTNIRALDAIRNWQLVSYDWLESGEHVDIGLIAQNSPEVMTYNEETDIYGIDAGKQTMINTLAIQQLDSKTNDEISQLKAQVASLQDELALLKGA